MADLHGGQTRSPTRQPSLDGSDQLMETPVKDQTSEPDGRIVVGVDGSPSSRTALRWAMTQARLNGATVEAVTVWHDILGYDHGYGMGYGWAAPTGSASDSMPSVSQSRLDATIAEVSTQLDEPVKVLTRIAQGHPAEVLTAAAAGAQMLVVGTRGHGTFAGILLGSVSQHCVQHAPCPVLVVPAAAADRDAATTHTPVAVAEDAWSQS